MAEASLRDDLVDPPSPLILAGTESSPDALLRLADLSADKERPTDASRSIDVSLALGSTLLDRTLERLNLFFSVPKKESRLRWLPLLLPLSSVSLGSVPSTFVVLVEVDMVVVGVVGIKLVVVPMS